MMLKDINPGSAASSAGLPFNLNGLLYFSANDGMHGVELWKSDGTSAGTQLVQDIYAGSGSSVPGNFASINGLLIFSATTGTTQPEVFRSDGTDAGTMMVKDIGPGNFGAHPLGFIPYNGMLYFQAYDVIHGFEIWKTDGTDAGTSLLKDLDPGTEGFSLIPEKFAVMNNLLYFTNNNNTNNTVELWKSDGTTTGTEMIKIISANASTVQPAFLLTVNSQLFFNGYDSGSGNELWKSDGLLSGTHLVKDINALPVAYYPASLADLNGTLYFSAFDALCRELWKSDGTDAGTFLFKDLAVGGGSASSNPQNFVKVGNDLYFLAYWGDINGWPQISKTDGTVAGTQRISNLYNPYVNNVQIGNLTESNGKLFFTGDANLGNELYVASGNTYSLVKDINTTTSGPPLMNPNGSSPQSLLNLNGTLFFSADNGVVSRELWKSDGTDAGTVLVKDINPFGSSQARSFANVNGTLFFNADDGVNGFELWKSDGTAAGTQMVKDIYPGPNSAQVVSITGVNGVAYFVATDGVNGFELWKSDGTAAGTVIVKDITAGPGNSTIPNLINFNGILLFTANDGIHGVELWKSDGSDAGTNMIKDINPGGASASPLMLTVIGNRVYFAANDGSNGVELWRSDVTASGTVLVQDFNPGNSSSNVSDITQSGNLMYVVALDNSGFNQLYVSTIPADAPLPVHLLTFKAHLNDKDGVLDWKTTSEVNTSSFEIERSTDARTFTRVGARNASGNTTSFSDYHFIDPNITLLHAKVVYYRLKMVDQDGSFTYSPIVVLNISSKNAVVLMYPNPASDFITMMISTRQRDKIQYSIVDATGRVVRSGTQNLQLGSNSVTVPLTEFSSGVYTIVIEGNNGKVQRSFVKK